MLSLEQAREAILAKIIPASETTAIPLDQALNHYVGTTLTAQVDNPAFDNSAMDGYAINCKDLDEANGYQLSLIGEAACGSAPAQLAPNSTMRIFTGAPLPQGADSVVMQENIEVSDGGKITFPEEVKIGGNIRRRGEDFKKGDNLYNSGHQITSNDLALLATAGIAQPIVWTPPRILVIATGDELISPGDTLQPGQIYESNRLTTIAQLAELGVTHVDSDTLRDDPNILREHFAGAQNYDFIITSGGASVGDYDLVKQIFSEIGEISFWKARIKPGKPIAFGRVGERSHFFALPGNPVASLVTFKLFIEPALIHWHHGTFHDPQLQARALGPYQRRPGRREFLRAQLSIDNGILCAMPLPGQGSHMVRPLNQTNGFIVVNETSSGFKDGDTITAIPLTTHIASGQHTY